MAANSNKTGAAPQFGDFAKFFGDFKLPNLDYNGVFSSYRRNIEALSSANQVINEGLQAVTRRQVELVKNNIEDMLGATRELWTTASPEAQAGKQAQLTKHLIEKTLVHVRELAEMASRSGFEAYDILNKRAVDSFEETAKSVK